MQRLYEPVAINFTQAIVVAVIGLAVNLVSAWLLWDGHDHHNGHGHTRHHLHDRHHDHEDGQESHEHGHAAAATDNNLRAAYLHVMADALTSVLAIAALTLGSVFGWLFLDPAIGILGALVIARWSWGLIRDAGAVLLDYVPADEDLPDEIRAAIETAEDRIVDLHVWQLGPGHHGAIVSVKSGSPKPVAFYRDKLEGIHDLSHVTVEVDAA